MPLVIQWTAGKFYIHKNATVIGPLILLSVLPREIFFYQFFSTNLLYTQPLL